MFSGDLHHRVELGKDFKLKYSAQWCLGINLKTELGMLNRLFIQYIFCASHILNIYS